MNRIWKSLLLGALLTAAARAESTYYSTHASLIGEPMAFPAPLAGSVFRDSRAAIEIVTVKGDGKIFTPAVVALLPGVADHATIPGRSGTALYQMPRDRLECWSDAGDKLVSYGLVDGVNILEISYRVRYPAGTKSEATKVVFITGEATNRITIP